MGLSASALAENPISLTAIVPGAAPTEAAVISVPSDGQSFLAIPINVSGTCPSGLLVKLFKNNVFGGSVTCNSGQFSLKVDLFSGQNDLVARVYDALDQAGPDSNTVKVTYGTTSSTRVTVTTNYAKRGANPGDTLTWPIVISGGKGPYAVSVDWGDGTTPDLISQIDAGNLELSHVYDSAGTYDILIRVSDQSGDTAYLQVVGTGNGPLIQKEAEQEESGVIVRNKTLRWSFLITIPLTIIAWLLGKRHEKKRLKNTIGANEVNF